MKHIYACLCGNWCDLTAEDTASVGENYTHPNTWWEEEGPDMFKYDYVNIHYKNQTYRIHPSFIQVVSKND